MHRFQDGVEKPKKRMAAWNDRVRNTSKNNDDSHSYYREFFDKKRREKQFVDDTKYVYKTPYHDKMDYQEYNSTTSYYWDRRSPINPFKPGKNKTELLENGFDDKFNVTLSQMNEKRYCREREFFDRPYNMKTHQFDFKKVKKPVKRLK